MKASDKCPTCGSDIEQIPCEYCDGTGKDDSDALGVRKCSYCGGKGYEEWCDCNSETPEDEETA